ncbi:hypothetical protein RFM26_09820 [Mesorhizobium sp. VK23B]|uniref:Uncharacterized protein n=1 Tax=Mesorhizobium dulcispinae TaxID=3072316 RepID=A0ABU4XDU1_9HYPH|nr:MULTISPECIES: hypothetical protein [unclassified Mesorhizobium]MDX8465976.1 hypothetical protein [Mesorhizobium sp. VK23B]MDX8471787.1 hypothetical protein [Mesorhizobium sp. VK23A]
MRRISIAIACAILSLPAAGPSWAGQCRQLLVSDLKIASIRQYADLLSAAARNGWNYTPAAIDSGLKRHFEETRLQLIAAGYEVVPVGAMPQCPQADELASK